jgi:trigger factor
MTEATTASCRREIELEIPAEEVSKSMEKVAREIARVARVPGFRPGKAPVTLIRRRFAEDIKSEVLQSLIPERLEKALEEQKLVPVTRPQVDKVDFPEAGPVKFRAVFEVFPEFELGEHKEIEVTVDAVEVTDEDVAKTLEELRSRSATFVPIEGRALADGDYAVLKIIGVPAGGGEPIQADNVLCHIGAEETMEAFNTNLRGAQPGDKKTFEATYPQDYPDPKLAGKTFHYTVDVEGIKEKKLPELNDEFAKDVNAESLDDLRAKIRQNLEAERDHRQREQAEQKLIEALIAKHEFPVPEALVEQQMDARLERVVRSLAGQGVDPRAVNVDWVSLRQRQREHAVDDVKAEMLLDKVATAENIEVTEEEFEQQIAHLAEHSGESAQAFRARLTKQGSLDRMKSKLRSDKTLEWLYRNARIQTAAPKDTKS